MKTSEIKKNVLKEIENTRLQREVVADANLKRALGNYECKEIFGYIKVLQIKKARLEFENKSTKEICEEIVKAKKKLENSLKKIGMSLKDFEVSYSCKKCGDTGTLGSKYCDCFYKKYNEALIKNLGTNIDRNHTFENSNFEIFDDGGKTRKLYEKISKWCDEIENSRVKTLVLYGDTGVGKTYLIECICNKLINKDNTVNYYTSFAINDLFYKYHMMFSDKRDGLLDDVLGCDVLIIDDLGSEPKIKTTEEYFYSIFNERLSKNLTTIISTNLKPLQIMERYGERTFSRLNNKTNSVMFKMENRDLRIYGKATKKEQN